MLKKLPLVIKIILSFLFLILILFMIFMFNSSQKPTDSTVDPADQALRIAQDALVEINPNADLVIMQDKTIKKEYGWIFSYTTQQYLETQNPKYLIPGTGPFIVTKDGEVHFLNTALQPDKAIEEFEASLQ